MSIKIQLFITVLSLLLTESGLINGQSLANSGEFIEKDPQNLGNMISGEDRSAIILLYIPTILSLDVIFTATHSTSFILSSRFDVLNI